MCVVALLCLGATTSCNAVAPFAQEIHRRTVPAGGSATTISQSHPTAASIRYEWDVRTDLTWEKYAEWIVVQLQPDFGAHRAESATMIFTRRLNGDLYRLCFEPVVVGLERHVHVTLDAAAD